MGRVGIQCYQVLVGLVSNGLQSFPGWLLSRMVSSRKEVSRKDFVNAGPNVELQLTLKSFRTTIGLLRIFKWIHSQFAPLPIRPTRATNKLVQGKYGVSSGIQCHQVPVVSNIK